VRINIFTILLSLILLHTFDSSLIHQEPSKCIQILELLKANLSLFSQSSSNRQSTKLIITSWVAISTIILRTWCISIHMAIAPSLNCSSKMMEKYISHHRSLESALDKKSKLRISPVLHWNTQYKYLRNTVKSCT